MRGHFQLPIIVGSGRWPWARQVLACSSYACAVVALSLLALVGPAAGQDRIPNTPLEAIRWLEDESNTVVTNDDGEVTEVIIDYVPSMFVVGDLDVFPKLEILKINYTGEFFDRHMSGIGRLKSLKQFVVEHCEEISEASISMLRYLPQLESVLLRNCEAIYSLKSLGECKSLKKIDLTYNSHLDFHALKSLQQLPNLESLVLSENSSLEDTHLRWLAGMDNLRELSLQECESLTDESVTYLQEIKGLKSLRLSANPRLTGELFEQLPEGLERLYIDDCEINDEALLKLAHLKNLKEIDYAHNPILGAGLDVFANFKRLEVLDLSDMEVGDRLLTLLAGIDSLKTVRLNRCSSVSGKGLAALVQSKGLETLELDGCRRIDHEDIATLVGFEKLKRLSLAGTRIRGQSVEAIASLATLESLDLSECKWIDDEALRALAKLPVLKSLTLKGVPRLTDDGLATLLQLKAIEELTLEENSSLTGSGLSCLSEHGGSSRLKKLVLSELPSLAPTFLSCLSDAASLVELRLNLSNLRNEHVLALKGLKQLVHLSVDDLSKVDNDIYLQVLSSLPKLEREYNSRW